MTILTDLFVPLHALLFWLRIEVVDPCFILSNELWNKFLLGHVGIVWEVPQKLVHSSDVSILDTIWQTLCSYVEMHKIYIAQKSHCACHVLSLAAIISKYYFNFILNRTRWGRELQFSSSFLTVFIVIVIYSYINFFIDIQYCLKQK